MLVERRIEGDRNERMRRDAQPASFNKIWRKILKHGVWVAIAFWTGGAWIMYYVDAPTVTRQTLQLTVQHDRAPLFVMVKDGALRNGYTLSFVNKTQQERIWRVSVSGLQQASIAPVEDSADRAAAVTFTAAADHVTDMRVMVFGRPDKLVNGTQTVRFVLSDIKTGETMTQESMFMGPGAQSWQ